MKTLAQIGELKTANAANGININSGTAIDTIEDTATMGEYDAMSSMYKSEKSAQNFEQQANNFTNQSNLDTISARNVGSSSKLNAFGSALSGVGQLSQQFAKEWYQFGNNQDNFDNGIKVSRWGTMP